MNAAEYFRLVLEQKKLIRHLNLHSTLEDWFAKFLVIHPLTKKDLKVWHKLKLNQKVGFLSRKLIKAAKKVELPNSLIDSYIDKKYRYKLFKTHKGVSELDSISATLNTDKDITVDEFNHILYKVYQHGKTKTRNTQHVNILFDTTILLIKSILEKSHNEIEKLLNVHD